VNFLVIKIECRAPHNMRLTEHNANRIKAAFAEACEDAEVFIDTGEDLESLTVACTSVSVEQVATKPRKREKKK
jgi:Ca2+-binding EF-hand superfamily protein